MSKLVDERVVEMKFDNSNFEKNTKQTMNTIDKLKSSLDFTGVANSINKSVNSVDMTPLTQGLEKSTRSFSAWEVAVISTISNITNRIVNLGVNLVKSLSIDNIVAGWQKYDESTISIGTLVSQGNSMELVTKEMEKLLWYTDQTSYNYQDMVANISKFTAAGIKLEDANKAMQGIANWAAASGQNAITASRAMYQLSQAIGAGTVKLMDWRSIQNTNMDTVQFREQALEAAVLAKELEKIVDASGEIQYRTKSGKTFNRNQFTEYLSEGWFTSDVLMSTLNEYSKGSEKVREIMEEFDFDNASEALEVYDKRLKEGVEGYTELGRTAFLAAQEARTFRDAINATKDAVSTNWLKTYELIFGNYEEATKLWTEFSNHLWDIFAAGGVERNKALKAWRGENDVSKGLKDNLDEAKKSITELEEKLNDVNENYNLGLISEDEYNQLKEYYETALDDSKELFDNLNSDYTRLKKTTDGRLDIFNTDEEDLGAFWNILTAVEKILDTVKGAFKEVFASAKTLKDITEAIQQFTKRLIISDAAAKSIGQTLKIFFASIKFGLKLIISVVKGFQPLIDFAKELITTLLNLTSDYGDALTEFVDKTTLFETITKVIAKTLTFLIDIVKRTLNFINNLTIKLTGKTFFGLLLSLGNLIKKAVLSIADAIRSFKTINTKPIDDFSDDVEEKLSPLDKLFAGIKSVLMGVWQVVKALVPVINEMLSFLGEALTNLGTMIAGAIKDKDVNRLFNFRNLFGAAFWASILAYFRYMHIFIRQFKRAFIGIFQGVADVLDSKAAMQYAQAIKTFASAVLIMVAAIVLLSMVDEAKLAKGIAAIVFVSSLMMIFMKAMGSMFNNKSTGIIKGISGIINNMAKAKAMQMVSKMIISFAAAVLMMSVALKVLATLEKEQLMQSLLALTVMFTLMVTAIKIIDTNKKYFSSGGFTMLMMSTAVLLLSSAIRKLSQLNKQEIKQGLISIAAIIAILVMTSKAMKITEGLKISILSAGMILLGAAFTAMAFAIKRLGVLKIEVLIKGEAAIAGMLGILVITSKLIGLTAGLKIALLSASMLLLGISFSTMSYAVKQLGKLSPAELAKGLISIALITSMMAALTNVVGLKGSVSLLLFSVALVALSASMVVFYTAVKLLSSIDTSKLSKGLMMFALGLAALVGITVLLKSIAPTLLAVSASLLMASISFALFTATLGIFVSLMSLLGSTLIDVLIALVDAIIEIAPRLGPAIAAILSAIFEGITGSIDSLSESLGAVLKMVLNLLTEYGPQIIEVVLNLLTQLLAKLDEKMPEIIKSVLNIVITILKALRDNTKEIIATLLEILDNIILALTEKVPTLTKDLVNLLMVVIESMVKAIVDAVPRLITAVFDLVLGLIEGLGQAIEDNAAKVREAILSFCRHIINAFKNFFGIHSPSKETTGIGTNIVQGLIQGISKMAKNVVKVIVDVGKQLLKGISKLPKEFMRLGIDLLKGLWNGIKSVVSGFLDFLSGLWQKIKEFFGFGDKKEEFKEAGKEMVVKYKEGMEDAEMDVNDTAKAVIQETMDTLSKTDIFKAIGEEIVNQIALGIRMNSTLMAESLKEALNDITYDINDAYDNLSEEDVLSQYLQKIIDIINDGLTAEDLTIKPIMDTSDIEQKTGMIAAALASVDGMVIGRSVSTAEQISNDLAPKFESTALGTETQGASASNAFNPNGAYSFVFNMYGVNDPKELAEQVAAIFQHQVEVNRR